MSMLVRGTESFIPPNAPIVGVNPMMYRFNNLGNILNPYMRSSSYVPPYVNEIQFYNPVSGQLGPNISQNSILSDMSQNMYNDTRYKPVIDSQIHSRQYDNGKINVGIIGTENDLNTVKSILDKYYSDNTTNTTSSVVKPPIVNAHAAPASAK